MKAMTLAQIDEILPNGFHDAKIEQLIWNFQTNSAVFNIEFWVATEEKEREKRQTGRVELQGVIFLAVDPPQPRQLDPKPYHPSGTLQIDGVLTNESIFPCLPTLKSALPHGIEIFSFYVVNWNSFIHIAATEAPIVWSDT
jgi:hypothetical protein